MSDIEQDQDAALAALREQCCQVAQADTAHARYRDSFVPGSLVGHCGCVAQAVYARFGGRVLLGKVQGKKHLWNRLPSGREVDLASAQLGGDGLHPVGRGGAHGSLEHNTRIRRFLRRLAAQTQAQEAA